MTKTHTRIIGVILLGGALLALWIFLPSLFPERMSRSGIVVVKKPALVRLALGYLGAGLGAGFGLALLLWPLTGPKSSSKDTLAKTSRATQEPRD